MKRFLLFAYVQYYPSGGAHDLAGDFDTLEEARASQAASPVDGVPDDFAHVLDTETGEVTDIETPMAFTPGFRLPKLAI